MCQVPAPGTWISRCKVLCARWRERWERGVSLKRALKMQFRNDYFRSLVHSSRKLWPKLNSDNSVPCILPCKIGGLQNLMKKRYLSKTPFLMEKERKLSFCGGEGKIIFWKRGKREKENFSDKWRDLVEFHVQVLGFPIKIHYLECPIPHSNLSTRIQIRVFIFGLKFHPHLASSRVVWDCRIEVSN